MPQQDRDVAAPGAQGRQGHGDDVQAEKQVLAKAPFPRQDREIAMGGADEAEVDGVFARIAHRANAFFLQGA